MTGLPRDLARASAMLDLRRHDEAARLLTQIVAADPADSRAWCLLAIAHLRAGQYKEAAAAASQAVTLAPSDEWPHRLASATQVRLGNIAAALRAANEACGRAPDEWRAWLCLAQAALATQVYFNTAERAAAAARRLAPDEPDVYFISGQVSFAREEWKAARAHHQRALALNPAHSGALNELGRIKLRRAGGPRAARHFLQAVRSAPGVSIYGQNVEVAVWRVVGGVFTDASGGSFALMYVTILGAHLARVLVVIGFAMTAVLPVGLGAVQLRRMPPQTRPLFHYRRITLTLGPVYGTIFIAIAVTALTPPAMLPGALSAVAAAMIAARLFAAYMIRRQGRPGRTRAP